MARRRSRCSPRANEIVLLISDVVMPVMDGPTMVREARKSRPDLKILFMSGYAEEQLRNSIDIDNVAFLPKPFSVQELAEAARRAVARNNRCSCVPVELFRRPMTEARCILIVEDEPLIAMMLEDFLESLGHSVSATCDNVPAALAEVEKGGLRPRHPRRQSQGSQRVAGGQPAARTGRSVRHRQRRPRRSAAARFDDVPLIESPIRSTALPLRSTPPSPPSDRIAVIAGGRMRVCAPAAPPVAGSRPDFQTSKPIHVPGSCGRAAPGRCRAAPSA